MAKPVRTGEDRGAGRKAGPFVRPVYLLAANDNRPPVSARRRGLAISVLVLILAGAAAYLL